MLQSPHLITPSRPTKSNPLSTSTNTTITMGSQEKPVIVGAAYPAFGHTGGPLQVAGHLASRGFKVYFVTGADFQKTAENLNIVFIENNFVMDPVFAEQRLQIADLNVRLLEDLNHVFADSIPTAHRALTAALELARAENPSAPVVLLHEVMSMGLLPFAHGAPLPKGYSTLPPTINFATHNNPSNDPDLPPFGPALPYDPTPENKALWKTIYDSMGPANDMLNSHWNSVMKPLGATKLLTGSLWDTVMTLGDVTVQPTSASTEYPRTSSKDVKRLRFVGGLPLKGLDPNWKHPAWWGEVTDNAALGEGGRKKVVFVTQGTVSTNYGDLILPAIRAFTSRTDLLAVITLGSRGASLPVSETPLPSHILVADYLPYDAILPFADVFVTNAGYNGFMHGVMNGVPMVLAGMEGDKGEVSARAEWCGVAVNLRKSTPTEEEINGGVDRALGDWKYKKRAVELKEENQGMDALGRMEALVLELAGR